MRDNHSHLKYLDALVAILSTASRTGLTIDRLGSESIEFVVSLGVPGDTLSGSVYITPTLEHGDLANGSDMAAVPDADIIGGINNGLGGFSQADGKIDANGEAGRSYKVGYRGAKRYVRVKMTITGTHTNGTSVGAIAVLGQLRYEGQNSMALGATGI